MLLTTIIIFFLAIISAFSMLAFKTWEMRTGRANIPENTDNILPDLSFRRVEKSMLYLTKHVVQWIVLWTAKHWFIITTKTKKKISDSWPRINAYLQKKPETLEAQKPSFISRAILESKVKINRIKEKVKREHGEEDNEI